MDNQQLWVRWGEVTRFLQSAQVAFGRERSTWGLLSASKHAEVRIKTKVGGRPYVVRLDQHLAALDDLSTLYSSVLIATFAIAEAAALDKIGARDRQVKIEDWGTKLLRAADKSWEQVEGNRAGAVEVSVMRNLFAHGALAVDGRSVKRLQSVGLHRFNIGDPVTITFEETLDYRNRLKSLLTLGGVS